MPLPTNTAKDYGYINPKQSHEILRQIQTALQYSKLNWWQPTEPSILAACEDPETLLSYTEDSTGREFPLPQTNQMHLEYELLKAIKENLPLHGLYCVTESYRDEKKQKERKADRIINKRFSMFEFEHRGGFDDLLETFRVVLFELGVYQHHIQQIKYNDVCRLLDKDPSKYILTDNDEAWLNENVAPVVLLTHFPERTNPFWNMKMNADGLALKVDLIMGGMECAGGAERSTNRNAQLSRFHALPGYADLLYNAFGKDNVINELNYYLSLLTHESVRSGAGIGLSRLAVCIERYKQQVGI